MDGFRKYADSYRIAEQLRKFADNEVVCCRESLANDDGELMPDTLLSVGFAKLTKEAKRRIKGKFADEVNKMKFSSSDIEYTVIYRRSNYFWTENLTVWTVTEDKLYLAKGEEADKLHRSIKAEEIIKSFVSGFVLFLLFAGIALILWHVWRMFYYAIIEI